MDFLGWQQFHLLGSSWGTILSQAALLVAFFLPLVSRELIDIRGSFKGSIGFRVYLPLVSREWRNGVQL